MGRTCFSLFQVRVRRLPLGAQAAFMLLDNSATARPCAEDPVKRHSWSGPRADPHRHRFKTWVRTTLCDSGVQILDPSCVRSVVLWGFSGWFILFPCLSAGLESGSGFGFCPGYGSSVSSRFASVPSPRSWAFRLMAGEAECMFAYPGSVALMPSGPKCAMRTSKWTRSRLPMAGSRRGTPFPASIPCNLHWNLHRSLYTLVRGCFRANQ